MRPIKDFDKVTPRGTYKRLEAGGYVLRILSAKDCHKQGEKENSYLAIVYDIAEGPEAGRYKDESPENDYRHMVRNSYKEKALSSFKQFTEAVEASNAGYKWAWAEETLVGKLVGVEFGYEEYEANDGSVKERLYVNNFLPVDSIRAGDFKVPELKKLPESKKTASPVPGFTPLTDENVPF